MNSESEYPFHEIPPVSRGIARGELVTYQGGTYHVSQKMSREKNGKPWGGWPSKPDIFAWILAVDNTHKIHLKIAYDDGVTTITELERIKNKA